MSIKCFADDYVVKEKNGIYYVYNDIYEESSKAVTIASLFSLLLPEAEDFYVPLCIKIEKHEGDIVIGKNLEVIGEADFKYFIAKHQYEKWKKTYRVIRSIIFLLGVIIDVLAAYLFWETHFHPATGICLIVMLFLTIGAIAKLEWNNHKRKKCEVLDVVF